MSAFEDSYLGKLRAEVGNRLLLVPGARIIIISEAGDILLQLRSDFHRWGLPGGIAEPGEALETVIEREVMEETGLTIRNIRPFGFASAPDFETFEFPNGDQTQFFVMNFFTDSYTGSIRADGDETLKLAWFAPDSLPDLLPNMRRSIDMFFTFKRTGTFQMF